MKNATNEERKWREPPFGLVNGRTYPTTQAVPIPHYMGWYDEFGERYGYGALNTDDCWKILAGLRKFGMCAMFMVLDVQSLQVTLSDLLEHCRFIFTKGNMYYVTNELGAQHRTFAGSTCFKPLLRRDLRKLLRAPQRVGA